MDKQLIISIGREFGSAGHAIAEELSKRFDIPLSVDTFNPSTAKLCLDEGVDIINDVSGVFSSEMAETIKKESTFSLFYHLIFSFLKFLRITQVSPL